MVDLNLLTSFHPTLTQFPDRIIYKTKVHQIEIISFQNIKDWLKDSDFPIEDSQGWILRIAKTQDLRESISIQCLLTPKDKNITSEVDTGESLDSIWIENDSDVVSIGTEDAEMMRFRAQKDDWMPSRFNDNLGYQSNSVFSFTAILKFGLETNLPELNKGEKIYFHYLVATNKRKKSKDYPNEDDISTNFAVDFPKWTLIERLNINEEITKC